MQAACGEPHPRVCIDSDDPQFGTEWTLLAVAAEALIERMTERDQRLDLVAPPGTAPTET